MAKKAPKPSAKDATQIQMTLADFQRRQRFHLKSPDVSYQHACNVMEKYRAELLKKKHVTGVDVGMKLQGPASTREFSVWVYVDQKLTPEEVAKLRAKDRIPEYLDDVPTDVHCSQSKHVNAPTPPGGTEITPKNEVNLGTLGFDVISHTDGRIRILTCAHVVADDGQVAHDSEMIVAATGTSLGVVSGRHGTGWDFSDVFDCALIKPPQPGLVRTGIPGGPQQPIRLRYARASDVSSELPVWKVGGTTGRTENGIVINHCTNSYPIGLSDGSVLQARRHVLIKPRIANGRLTAAFAQHGDSGAIVCIDDEAIGILRAVDETTGIVAAAPIVDASAALGFGI